MSTINVSGGDKQLPSLPAGEPASKAYKLFMANHGPGYLVGPTGVGIFNDSSPVPAGNYTYLPEEGAPPLKKAKQSQDDLELFSAQNRYFEKLLEPPADLPQTVAELQEFLVQTPVKLPVHSRDFYGKVGEPMLLTREFSEETRYLPSIVDSALATMDNLLGLNEATSSAELCAISGEFIKRLNAMAPRNRRLENMLVVLDSPNPNSTQTASRPLEGLASPDLQLYVKGCLVLRWENKLHYNSLPEAMRENSKKYMVLSVLRRPSLCDWWLLRWTSVSMAQAQSG